MIVCLYQIFKSRIELIDDCSICISDEKNKQCPKYCPITLWTVELDEKSSLIREQQSLE